MRPADKNQKRSSFSIRSNIANQSNSFDNMYPSIFLPTDIEPFNFGDETFAIPKCIVKFDRWIGQPILQTFGGKPLVMVDNKPMFAELAIMTYFAQEAWEVRWVETYGKTKPIYMTEWKDDKYKNQIHRPFLGNFVENLLANIAKENLNSYAGCWDVVAYKDDRILFAESKRTKKDKIRTTQANWLAAAMRYGLHVENFLVIQWEM